MKRIFVFFMFLVTFNLRSHGLDSPTVYCISLDENDDITLTWTLPLDTGNSFNSYIVYYRSASASQFSSLATITDYNQSSVTINGSFAGAGSFYVVTDGNGADTSLANDTVSPLIITLFSSGRNVQIQWSEINLPSTDSVYSIYRRLLNGSWELRGQVPFGVTQFQDTSNVCDAEYEYQISFEGKIGCLNSSNVGYKHVIDNIAPSIMNLLSASVDTATGNVNLNWGLNPSIDVNGYRVFYYSDFNWSHDLFGPANLHYNYSLDNINALARAETLSVAAFDSCFDAATNWYNQAATDLKFQTLFAEIIEYDRCLGTASIKWNMPTAKYPVGVANLSGFKVYRKSSQSISELRAVLSPIDSVFVDEGITPGVKFDYVVVAFDTIFGVEAMGNKVTFNEGAVAPPSVQYISQVRNDHESANNVLTLLTDSISEVRSWKLMRSFDPSKTFQEVNLKKAQPSSKIEMVDEIGKANETSYYYKIEAFDECGAYISSSNVVRSIFLDGEKDQKNYNNQLFWNAYEGFEMGNGSFELYRVPVHSDSNVILTSSSEREFEDDLEGVENLGGNMCYYIKYNESTSNSNNVIGASISNLRCLNFSPKVFIPNAFSPDGDLINDVFMPYSNYIDQQEYELLVYNRTGNLIFTSNDPQEGWSGKDQEVGIYYYKLHLTNSFGEMVEFSGKVNLIR